MMSRNNTIFLIEIYSPAKDKILYFFPDYTCKEYGDYEEYMGQLFFALLNIKIFEELSELRVTFNDGYEVCYVAIPENKVWGEDYNAIRLPYMTRLVKVIENNGDIPTQGCYVSEKIVVNPWKLVVYKNWVYSDKQYSEKEGLK